MKIVYFLASFLVLASLVASDCPGDCSGHGDCVRNVCHCTGNWDGSDCSLYNQYLNSGETTVGHEQWRFYRHTVGTAGSALLWWVNQTSADQDCDLYLKFGDFPTRASYSSKNVSTSLNTFLLEEDLLAGIYYGGVFGYSECSYAISVTEISGCPRGCSSHGVCVEDACQCYPGYGGEICDYTYLNLEIGDSRSGHVATGKWDFFHTTVPHGISFAYVIDQVDGTAGDCDLFVAYDRFPTLWDWDFSNTSLTDISTVQISSSQPGRYVLGVFGFSDCSFEVTVQTVVPSDECLSRCSLHGRCVDGECRCNPGFSGDDCEWMEPSLALSRPQDGFVAINDWNYYNTRVITQNSLVITLNQMTGDCDVYVRGNDKPTLFDYDYFDMTNTSQIRLAIRQPGDTTWYIGIFGWAACQYSIAITEELFCDCGLDNPHGHCHENGIDCVCDEGWSGVDCSTPLRVLANQEVVSGEVTKYHWQYYEFLVDNSTTGVLSLKERDTVGLLWMFVSFTGVPTLTTYDLSNKETRSPYHEISINVLVSQTRKVYMGVYGNPFGLHEQQQISFDLVAWAAQF